VGHAITNLMQTSSMLSEYVEFLHRLNIFAFKPCEYCTVIRDDLAFNSSKKKDDLDKESDKAQKSATKDSLEVTDGSNIKDKEKQMTVSFDEIAKLYLSLDGTSSQGDENAIQGDCSKAYGKHFVITFCQRMSLNDIYDHDDPGYLAPHDIPNKRCSLLQINASYLS
jgi:hypothetical protein